LFGDEGVGAGFDDASVDCFRAEDAAQVSGGFVESVFGSGAAAPILFEGEGRGESGDASADNGDASHEISSWLLAKTRGAAFTFLRLNNPAPEAPSSSRCPPGSRAGCRGRD